MITVLWDGRTVAWWGEEEVTVSPWSDDAVQEVIEALRRPATIRVSEEVAGVIGEAELELSPGSVQHARAVLLSLPGNTVLVAET